MARTFLSGEEARGHVLLKPDRRADGEHPVAHGNVVRVAERDRREVSARVHLDDGDVGLLVGADYVAAQLLARLELDHDARHVLDDMGVREDDALRVNYEAAPDAARRTARVASKHVEQRVVAVVVVLVAVLPGSLRRGGRDRVNVDDRRLDAARDFGEGGGESFGRAGYLRGARRRRVVERDGARAAEHRADAYSSDEARRGEGRDPHTELAQYRALGISRLAFRDLQHKTSHLQIL